jgi:hypothetical protein
VSSGGGASGGAQATGQGGTAPSTAGDTATAGDGGDDETAGAGATTSEGGRSATATGGNAGTLGAFAGSGGAGAGGPVFMNPNVLGTGELGACNSEGWCWQAPASAGDLFYAISEDGRYAVGEHGVVFEWPDRYLPSVEVPSLSVVANVNDTLWAAGGSLWQFDGTAWIQGLFGSSVFRLSTTPAGEPWVLLLENTLMHLVGDTWEPERPPAVEERGLQLLDVIAIDDDRIWALATSRQSTLSPEGELTLFEWTRDEWSELPSSVEDPGNAWQFLRVGGQIHVYCLGGIPGAVYSPLDGWTVVAEQPPAPYGLFAAPSGGMIASTTSGLYAVPAQGTEKISNAKCRALVATSDAEALCAHASGGLSLIRPGEPATDEPDQLAPDRFGSVPIEVWAQSIAAWGTGPSDVWRAPLDHFDGTTWSTFPAAAPSDFSALGIHGSASDNVWFRSDQAILRWDGSAFQEIPLPVLGGAEPHFVSAIHTLGPADAWAVSGTPDIVHVWHFDGVEWEDTLSVENSFAYSRSAFAGGGSEPLWAAVGQGLYRRDGETWERVAGLPSLSLVDVAVSGTDVWALGQDAVYQLVDGALVPRGVASGVLSQLALTDEYVWHFSVSNVRTLPR